MSTDFSEKLEDISAGPFAMLLAPMKRESLAEYVKRKIREMPEGGSHVKVADRARERGHTISPGYVNNICQGDAKNPSVSLLLALAAGLGVSPDEIWAVAKGKPFADDAAFQESDFAQLWDEYKRLSPQKQKERKPLVEMLAREIRRP